ncbi:MAG TPA: hypothetical protein VGB28_05170, partial [Actinomycetota bacterium]
ALLLARPWSRALATTLGPQQASRTSRLFPGTTLVHADLHNHSLLSDGDGDAANAFVSMRDAGLDVAALTDHSTFGLGAGEACPPGGCSLVGINEERWQRAGVLADAANADGAFTAIRGFEWSSPTLGHVNVWFSERWIDPFHTGGTSTGEGAAQFAHENVPGADDIAPELEALVRSAPTNGAGMRAFYEWLKAPTDTPVLGGGLDGIAGFNHPGREPGRFGYFAHDPGLAGRIVSLEVFNRSEDYLFEGTENGYPSPLNDCLNAGWRVGLLGVTDEHGTSWGAPTGKGRAGLWVGELSRPSVREAMSARRFFATRERGLRVDASANGIRMGGVVPHSAGPVRFELDIDRGEEWYGRDLSVQILRPGTVMPSVAQAVDVRVPINEGPDQEPVISFEVPIDAADGDWTVLRISDPNQPPDGRADDQYRSFGRAIAYTSPFFLQP